MDELPEFNKSTLEVLRGPLEDRKITISRVATPVTYPSNFMLVASMNPCECGYYGSALKKCTCNSKSIKRYVNKISGPMLDRIDLHIEVRPVEYEKMANDNKNETSKQIKERVLILNILFLNYLQDLFNYMKVLLLIEMELQKEKEDFLLH